jgi:hypothetical protein
LLGSRVARNNRKGIVNIGDALFYLLLNAGC